MAGVCSEQTLFAIEKNECETDAFMIDVLLQRLGRSADKLEVILSLKEYGQIKQRDEIEQSILKGEKEKALSHINRAILLTLPQFSYERIEKYLISNIEMENLLAAERIRLMQGEMDKAWEHLKKCMEYIDAHITDNEEYAKIGSKCVWLLGKCCYAKSDYTNAMALCEKGITLLRKENMLYFMHPLLWLMTAVTEKLGFPDEKNKWKKYYNAVDYVYRNYAEKWYPRDMLFYNCCLKEYYLDCELIKFERISQGFKQEQLIEGIYQNPESLSRIENGKVSPNKTNFELFMKKLGIQRGRYCGYVVTDSFEDLERRSLLERTSASGDYLKAQMILEKMKKNLDVEDTINQRYFADRELEIDQNLHKCTVEDAAAKQKKCWKDTWIFRQINFAIM